MVCTAPDGGDSDGDDGKAHVDSPCRGSDCERQTAAKVGMEHDHHFGPLLLPSRERKADDLACKDETIGKLEVSLVSYLLSWCR